MEQGHVNGENLHDTVLMIAANNTQVLEDNADEIIQVLGQDLFDKVMHSIPKTKKASQRRFYTCIPDKCKDFFEIFIGTSLACLVCATMLEHPKQDSLSLKSVLASLRKILITKTAERTTLCSSVVKKLISNIQRETVTYRKKCEEIIETVTDGSPCSVDIVRSLLKDQKISEDTCSSHI